MKILLLTTGKLDSLHSHSLYPDLIRELIKHGHEVFSVSSHEKRFGKETECSREDHAALLKVKIGNLTKSGILEKGVAMLRINRQYRAAIKEYYRGVHFDLILYSTPPITLVPSIRYFKKRDHARTYLMLKDIFPQNAVDIGILKKTGLKGFAYRFFRRKEKQLYKISDKIGAMSAANVAYLLRHNPELTPDRVEVFPNSAEIHEYRLSSDEKNQIRRKYGIPTNQTVFIYGGNLGKPQDIPFIISCIKESEKTSKAYFIIVGDGTECGKIKHFVDTEKPNNLKFIARLPVSDYNLLAAACDVGLIFLDHRFTIPNFPSRLLSYMEAGLPVLACTDPVSDIGSVIVDAGCGWWCQSDHSSDFTRLIEEICQTPSSRLTQMSENSRRCLREKFDIRLTYQKTLIAEGKKE